ncbi:hypothetical protein GCM10023116_48600 [Kistimonas scapharcae]|uniref:Uncharacterized protein n=2 Tax=Kistimonas scapharcae TaxID=1036133 RepID=A0ABP8VA38_9GAMM
MATSRPRKVKDDLAYFVERKQFSTDVSSIIAIRTGMLKFASLKGFAQETIRKATGYDPDKYHQAISWAYKEQHVVEKLKKPLIPEIPNGDYASDQAAIS